METANLEHTVQPAGGSADQSILFRQLRWFNSSFRKFSWSLPLSVCVGCSESLPGNSPALKLFSRGLYYLSTPREEWAWWICSVLGTSWSCWVVFFLSLTNVPEGQNISPPLVPFGFSSLLIACVLASFPTKWKIFSHRGNCYLTQKQFQVDNFFSVFFHVKFCGGLVVFVLFFVVGSLSTTNDPLTVHAKSWIILWYSWVKVWGFQV